tara:strand:- start:1705 stop:2583 length:879 start_codon:yes stop_codon:yes gene_type:complete
MISCLSIGRFGRLGNQLFQYAALKSLSLENNLNIVLPYLTNSFHHGQKSLLPEFNLDVKYMNRALLSLLLHKRYYEKEEYIYKYDENFFKIKDFTSIKGYFQNLKYFKRYKEQICMELTPKKKYIDSAQKIISEIKSKYPNHELVSLHIRLGDAKNNKGHADILYGSNMQILDQSSMFSKYINKSIDFFRSKNVKFLIFFGGSRDENDDYDRDWVYRSFKSDQFIVMSCENPLIDYSLISLCDHNILSHVSSFSWWAAYTNRNKNKTMIAPKDYYLTRENNNILFDESFTLL